MFKKFTDTLTGTLDTVKSYGSSMGIGQAGQEGVAGTGTAEAKTSMGSKLTLNLPVLGNGSVSAPATTTNSPDRSQKPSLASNTLMGLQNTIGKITGRGDSNNAVVMATQNQNRSGRGPALGRAVEVNETRMTERHDIDDDMRGLTYHDITDFEKYKKVSNTGQLEDYEPPPTSERMNGDAPRLVRSNTDEIIHQQFLAAQNNLDDALNMAEELDDLAPVEKKKDDEEEKPKKKKKKNKHISRCIDCIQDNRVKGGCVDPEEMNDSPEDSLVLKKVLNIVFLVIGSLLFIAVFAVIIYTSLADKGDDGSGDDDTTPGPLNLTGTIYEYVVPEYDETESWRLDLGVVLNEEELKWVKDIKESMDIVSEMGNEG